MQSDMFLDFGNDNQHIRPKTYTQYMPDEIMKSSIEYFGGDELAANVWMNKYALRDEDKIYELNPDMMHHRLASEFARIEHNYPNPMSEETIYDCSRTSAMSFPKAAPCRASATTSKSSPCPTALLSATVVTATPTAAS